MPQPTTSVNRIHIFAISMSTSAESWNNFTQPILSVRRVRSTSRWEVVNDTRAEVVEVTLANLVPQSDSSQRTSINSRHEIEVIGTGLATVVPGVIHRLVASDQVRVDVLVNVAQTGGNATIQIKDSVGNILSDAAIWQISPLQENWTPDAKVLGTHETPTWVCLRCCLLSHVFRSLTILSVEPGEVWNFVSLLFRNQVFKGR